MAFFVVPGIFMGVGVGCPVRTCPVPINLIFKQAVIEGPRSRGVAVDVERPRPAGVISI